MVNFIWDWDEISDSYRIDITPDVVENAPENTKEGLKEIAS